jgi:DNA-directed RNA polymerase specialized sigma24 family protein
LKKLYFVEGFSIRETARILGVSKTTVWRTANEMMENMEVVL